MVNIEKLIARLYNEECIVLPKSIKSKEIIELVSKLNKLGIKFKLNKVFNKETLEEELILELEGEIENA